jgi:hypothetical protein
MTPSTAALVAVQEVHLLLRKIPLALHHIEAVPSSTGRLLITTMDEFHSQTVAAAPDFVRRCRLACFLCVNNYAVPT